MKTRRCSTCREEFPATGQYFHAHRAKKDGLQYDCKECRKGYAAEQRKRIAESGIYVLRCIPAAAEYVGHTTTGLRQRLSVHKSHAYTLKGRLKTPDVNLYNCMRTFDDPSMWSIEWLSQMPGATREELLVAEQAHIEARNPVLNTNNAIKEST